MRRNSVASRSRAKYAAPPVPRVRTREELHAEARARVEYIMTKSIPREIERGADACARFAARCAEEGVINAVRWSAEQVMIDDGVARIVKVWFESDSEVPLWTRANNIVEDYIRDLTRSTSSYHEFLNFHAAAEQLVKRRIVELFKDWMWEVKRLACYDAGGEPER